MAYIRCSGNIGGSLKLRTASGAIASFETNYVAPLNSLKCEITAKQDLHGYDHPWAGGAGTNKTDISDNTISGAGYVIGGFPVAINSDNSIFPSGNYVFSFNLTGATYPCACQLIWYRNGVEVGNTVETINSSGINSIAFTSSGEFDSFVMFCNSSSGGAFTNFNLNIGSTPSAYEPYSNICPIVGHSELKLANVDDTTAQLWTADKGFDGVVDFNQLATGFVTQTVDDLTVTNNNDGSITVNGTASANGDMNITSYIHFLSTHKYLIKGYKKVGSNNGSFSFSGVGIDSGNGNIWNNDISDINLLLRFAYSSGDTFNNVVMYPQIYDLTQMFDASIADYIYTLEQGQAGAGVAFFEHFYPEDYYPYNVGETQTLVQMPYTVAFGQTVYGGVYDKSGRLTITHGFANLNGTEGIYWQTLPTGDASLTAFYISVSSWESVFGSYPKRVASGELLNAISNELEIKPQVYFTLIDSAGIYGWTDNSVALLIVPPSGVADLNTWLASNNLSIAYELATPIVIDVPSISVFAENGTNNIVSDGGGDVNVSYLELIRGT